MGKAGKGFGILALLIAIVALGIGAYQIILPSPSEGSMIYVDSNYNDFEFGLNTFTLIPNLNVT